MRKIWLIAVLAQFAISSLIYAYNCEAALKAFFPDINPATLSPFMQKVYALFDASVTKMHKKENLSVPDHFEVNWVDKIPNEKAESDDVETAALYSPGNKSYTATNKLKNNLFTAQYILHEIKHEVDDKSGFYRSTSISVVWPLSPTKALEISPFTEQHNFITKVKALESYKGEYIDELLKSVDFPSHQSREVLGLFLKRMNEQEGTPFGLTESDQANAIKCLTQIAAEKGLSKDEINTIIADGMDKVRKEVNDYFVVNLGKKAFLEDSLGPYQDKITAEEAARRKKAKRIAYIIAAIAAPSASFWAYYCHTHNDPALCFHQKNKD